MRATRVDGAEIGLTASQRGSAQAEMEVGARDRKDEAAARAKQPGYFAQCGVDVFDVFQHRIAEDKIEAVVGKADAIPRRSHQFTIDLGASGHGGFVGVDVRAGEVARADDG